MSGTEEAPTENGANEEKTEGTVSKTVIGASLAKKRLQAYKPSTPVKRDEKSEEGKNVDKTAIKKNKKALYPDERAKAVISEIEEIKKKQAEEDEINKQKTKELVESAMKTLENSKRRGNILNKKDGKRRRNYRKTEKERRSLSPLKKDNVNDKSSSPKSWREYHELNLKEPKYKEKKKKELSDKVELYKRLYNFNKSSPLINDRRSSKSMSIFFLRMTKTKPHLTYSVNFRKNKESFLQKSQLFHIVSPERKQFMEKLINSSSNKSNLVTKPITSRPWYHKSWKKVRDAECNILENSVGLSFLQNYSDEEEEEEDIVENEEQKEAPSQSETKIETKIEEEPIEKSTKDDGVYTPETTTPPPCDENKSKSLEKKETEKKVKKEGKAKSKKEEKREAVKKLQEKCSEEDNVASETSSKRSSNKKKVKLKKGKKKSKVKKTNDANTEEETVIERKTKIIGIRKKKMKRKKLKLKNTKKKSESPKNVEIEPEIVKDIETEEFQLIKEIKVEIPSPIQPVEKSLVWESDDEIIIKPKLNNSWESDEELFERNRYCPQKNDRIITDNFDLEMPLNIPLIKRRIEIKTPEEVDTIVISSPAPKNDNDGSNLLETEYEEFIKALNTDEKPPKVTTTTNCVIDLNEVENNFNKFDISVKEEIVEPQVENKPAPVPSPKIDIEKLPKPLINLSLSANITLDIGKTGNSPSNLVTLQPVKVGERDENFVVTSTAQIINETVVTEEKPLTFSKMVLPTKRVLLDNSNLNLGESDEEIVEETKVQTSPVSTKKSSEVEVKKAKAEKRSRSKSPYKKREKSPKRRKKSRSASPRRRKSEGSPRRRRSSPRRCDYSPRRRSPISRRRSSPVKQKYSYRPLSPSYRKRSPSPFRRSSSPKSKKRRSKTPPTIPEKRNNLPDSTIPDDLLQQQASTQFNITATMHQFNAATTTQFDATTTTMDLGELKPIETTYADDYSYQHYKPLLKERILKEYEIKQEMMVPSNNFVQIGNMVQIVPVDLPMDTTSLVNIEGMDQQQHRELKQIIPVEDYSQIFNVREPVEQEVKGYSQVYNTEQEVKKETEIIAEAKEKEARKAERERRRIEKEQRRKEKEMKRKEKEKRRREKEKQRQVRLKIKTENMIKKALQLEVAALAEEEDEVIPTPSLETPIQWPPLLNMVPKDLSKSILRGSKKSICSVKKSVQFADGIKPGEGTSPSGGEELGSPTQKMSLPKEKRYTKTKLKRKKPKKKVKVKVIKKSEFIPENAEDNDNDDEDENLPPPSPPPGSPPPHIFPPRIKAPVLNNIHPVVQNQPFRPTGVDLIMVPPPPPPHHHHHHHHHHPHFGTMPPPPHHHGAPPPPISGPPPRHIHPMQPPPPRHHHHHHPPPPGPIPHHPPPYPY